jgi:hypothetical protein
VIGIAAHERRKVEGHRQSGPPCRNQILVSLIGFLGCAEAGKLPHRPELAAVARRVNATRIRELSGIGEIAVVVERRDVGGGVKALDRPAGNRGE